MPSTALHISAESYCPVGDCRIWSPTKSLSGATQNRARTLLSLEDQLPLRSNSTIEFVSATRGWRSDFEHRFPLGRSLLRLGFDRRISSSVTTGNSAPLADVYNRRIDDSPADVLAFIHDDIWLDDCFVGDRILAGLDRFDIIGIAGNRRRYPHQRAWHMSAAGGLDTPNLSGVVSDGTGPFGTPSFFGPPEQECDLLDGLFLAASKRTLQEAGVRFDPRFAFHFYDLDFCRSARAAGLTLGTWSIAMTHQTKEGRGYGSASWLSTFEAYQSKWPD